MDWLDDMTEHVAGAHGLEREGLRLDPAEQRTILDLARVASHTSGNRINAPLLCYVLGLARARGATLEDLAATVRAAAGDPEAGS